MPTERSGTYTLTQAGSGTIRVRDVPGTSGIAHTVAVTMAISGLTPSDPDMTIQMFPSGAFTQGVDENGNIGVSITFTPDATDTTRRTWYSTWSGVPLNFPDGFDLQEFRTAVNFSEDVNVDWNFQFGNLDLATDFPEELEDAVTNEDVENIQFDEETETGSGMITFDYTGDEEPTGFATEYQDGVDWFPDGNIPWEEGTTHYEIPTYTFESPSSFPVRITPYKITPDSADYAKGPPSATIPVEWTGDEPDIDFEGGQTGGFIDLGGTATVVLSADPSGIYTLVPGKTNDTLYDRDETPVVTVDVKIPDPFIRTGFLE